MTANIDPIRSPAPPAAGQPAKTSAAAGASQTKFGEALAKARSAGAPDAVLPPTPPAELGANIAAAARAWEALAADGRHVSFSETAEGRVSIQLSDGESAEELTGSGLFDLIDAEGGA